MHEIVLKTLKVLTFFLFCRKFVGDHCVSNNSQAKIKDKLFHIFLGHSWSSGRIIFRSVVDLCCFEPGLFESTVSVLQVSGYSIGFLFHSSFDMRQRGTMLCNCGALETQKDSQRWEQRSIKKCCNTPPSPKPRFVFLNEQTPWKTNERPLPTLTLTNRNTSQLAWHPRIVVPSLPCGDLNLTPLITMFRSSSEIAKANSFTHNLINKSMLYTTKLAVVS